MADDAELEARLWKELRSQMTVMLGLDGARDGHVQPMTAVFDDQSGNSLWFFTTKDNTLVSALGQSHRAIASFTSKGHDLFATLHGALAEATDPAVVDRLWNPHIAAWYDGGKSDPRLCLLRLDPEKATIWKNGNSIVAAVTRLLGQDPKESYKDNMAEVAL
jgi:general stress protein 26